jgi:thioredoxin:protein disulfide reductase
MMCDRSSMKTIMPNRCIPMYRRLFALCLLLLVTNVAVAGGVLPGIRTLPGAEPKFLPVDEAFQLSVAVSDGTVTMRWHIAPGYYLYKSKLDFSASGRPLEASIPSGTVSEDEYFGKVEVFHEELTVSLELADSRQADVISVVYQGCAEAGLCYPPQKREISL